MFGLENFFSQSASGWDTIEGLNNILITIRCQLVGCLATVDHVIKPQPHRPDEDDVFLFFKCNF